LQVSVIGADGQLSWSTIPGWQRINLADRPHFSVHKERASDELDISAPVLGRASKQWTIQFTRPIYDRQQRFAGVLVFSVPPPALQRIYSDIDLGEGSVITLARSDGQILASSLDLAAASQVSLAVFPEYRADSPVAGTVRRVSKVNGVERLFSYRKVSGYPLVVSVGQAVNTVFAPYRAQRTIYLVAGALATVLLLALTRLLIARRIAKEGAHRHRAQLAAIVQGSDDGIMSVDLDGKIDSWNAGAERLLGYSAAEAMGRQAKALMVPPDRMEETTQAYARIDRSESVPPFDTVRLTKDGRRIDVAVSLSQIKDQQGRVSGLSAILRDITERKGAEDQLRQFNIDLERMVEERSAQAIAAQQAAERSQKRFQDLFESTPDAILLANRQGHVTMMNRQAETLFGWCREELVGQPLETLLPKGLRHHHPALFQSYFETPAVRPMGARNADLQAVRRDGTVFPVEISLSPFESEDSMQVVAAVRDISERKRAADLLKAQQTQVKLAAQVFAQGREGVTITDAQGNIVMVNKASTAITGYTEADLLGKNPRVLSSGRHGPEFYRAMWESINIKDYWTGEIWNQRKDGTVYPEWMTITSMRDEQERITHYLASFSDLSDAKAAEDRIQWLSHFDSLTGLPNRALLQDRTNHSISLMQRANEPLTMMLVGIDHFKAITDTLGHQVGDALLVEMAKRLSESVRDQDTVARLADKEFVLVLPDTAAIGAAHLATELLWKLAQPYQLGDHELILTASIGIASYPDNGGDFESLLKAVEIAMHRAQAKGRDTFQFYSADLYQQVLARDHMVKALRQAAALDQLQLVFQPLVDLQTGQISGLEALLRWQHPELGLVSPAQFIPVAEESGLIKGIGEWVLRQACRDIRTWLDKGIKVPHVAVNVSPLQFHDADLIAQVKSALADYRVDPSLVYLEVTESALMHDVHRSEAMLKELKGLGVKLSLDDFGTGYSSLSYLKRFPFDKVKIDQSFVRDITTNQSDAVIVKVIVSMAHGLGLKVIAEGVETEAQCEIMRTSVCDEIQGYFFSKPISAQAIEELFSEGRQLPAHLLRLQKPQRTLLLVDDEPNIVASLKRLFRRDGHVILTANSGPEGLDVLSRHKVDVIISDQRMPGMTGVEFLRVAKVNYPNTIRIVLSGYTDLQSVTDAINEGAVYRFFTKPWDDEHLREQIQKAFEYKELLEENQQLDIKIRTTNQELVAANQQLGDVLQKSRHQIERDETSLAIVREALQHMPLPVIGVDDEGLIVFVNAAAESRLTSAGPLLGVELVAALPAIDAAITAAAEGIPCELLIDDTRYLIKWNPMGANSRSKGRLVTLIEKGLNS
jgi:diguanylate cyclase (GGDEF)-like protein/PAS domain S-box-containing protein